MSVKENSLLIDGNDGINEIGGGDCENNIIHIKQYDCCGWTLAVYERWCVNLVVVKSKCEDEHDE